MTNQKQIRDSFWEINEQWADARRSRKTHNDYNGTIRCAFVNYVDSLARDGVISERLANRVTL